MSQLINSSFWCCQVFSYYIYEVHLQPSRPQILWFMYMCSNHGRISLLARFHDKFTLFENYMYSWVWKLHVYNVIYSDAYKSCEHALNAYQPSECLWSPKKILISSIVFFLASHFACATNSSVCRNIYWNWSVVWCSVDVNNNPFGVVRNSG